MNSHAYNPIHATMALPADVLADGILWFDDPQQPQTVMQGARQDKATHLDWYQTITRISPTRWQACKREVSPEARAEIRQSKKAEQREPSSPQPVESPR
jgi:hypothetical protein